MLGAGGFGVVLYLTLSQTFPRLGATAAFIHIILGQLLTGVAIDHFGLFGGAVRPLDLRRAVGLLLVVVGAYVVLRSRRLASLAVPSSNFGSASPSAERLLRRCCSAATSTFPFKPSHISMQA
jgi:hypothetical protein